MSFLDKAKNALNQAKDKAADLAEQHGDKIEKAIDKGGDFIDEKTKGKYSDKVDKVQGAAKSATEKLAAQGDVPTAGEPADGPTASATAVPDPEAPAPQPPPSATRLDADDV